MAAVARRCINRRAPYVLFASHRQLTTAPTPLLALGIETSCDDTACAVVSSSGAILANVVAAQSEHHEPHGGIVPNVATQRHSAALPGTVRRALRDAGVTIDDIGVVAVTQGPGLAPCLAVGLNAAKTLAAVCEKPLAPVHHMVRRPPAALSTRSLPQHAAPQTPLFAAGGQEAHLLTARLCAEGGPDAVPFPFLCLLMSGGHTILVLAKVQHSGLPLVPLA